MSGLTETELRVMRMYAGGRQLGAIATSVGMPRDLLGATVYRLCAYNRQRAAAIVRDAGTMPPVAPVAEPPKLVRKSPPKGAVPPTRAPATRLPATGEPLTEREQQVLECLGEGLMCSEIAVKLLVGESTAKTHTTSLYRKLGAVGGAHAVMLGVRAGLLPGGTAPTSPPVAIAPVDEPAVPVVVAAYGTHWCDSHRYSGPAAEHVCPDVRPVLVTVSEVAQ